MMFAAPSGPITAISAVGQATTKSAPRWREHMAMYPPPYALRRMTVIFGTVASLNAYRSFAPCLMTPACSCSTPGRYPGRSTNVMRGIPNASQNRMNLAPLSEESTSSTPARTIGWFATIPTVSPSTRAKPTTRFAAQLAWTSRNSELSHSAQMTFLTSYGFRESIGTIRSISNFAFGGLAGYRSAFLRLFQGIKVKSCLILWKHSNSFLA